MTFCRLQAKGNVIQTPTWGDFNNPKHSWDRHMCRPHHKNTVHHFHKFHTLALRWAFWKLRGPITRWTTFHWNECYMDGDMTAALQTDPSQEPVHSWNVINNRTHVQTHRYTLNGLNFKRDSAFLEAAHRFREIHAVDLTQQAFGQPNTVSSGPVRKATHRGTRSKSAA